MGYIIRFMDYRAQQDWSILGMKLLKRWKDSPLPSEIHKNYSSNPAKLGFVFYIYVFNIDYVIRKELYAKWILLCEIIILDKVKLIYTSCGFDIFAVFVKTFFKHMIRMCCLLVTDIL